MTIINLSNYPFTQTREGIRKEIIELFLNELPGTGRYDLTSRYRYITKILSDSREVYLNRPANFNNGFDFTLNVSGTNFNAGINKRPSTRPTHVNILDDLIGKKIENEKLYIDFKKQIDRIYRSLNPTQIIFSFKSGHSSELILECIKWLFVEQDVTYWNYSGRVMLYNSINEI